MEILNDVIPVYIFPGFTCALQKEILYQGKLFVSENWICFHSKVFGKDTKVSIFFKTNLAFSYVLLIVKCSNVYKYLCHYYTFIPSFLDRSPKYYRF